MEPTFTTRWFYAAVTGKEIEPGAALCAVCGLPMVTGSSPSKVLRKTFTDYAALRQPESMVVCAACSWYFDNQKLRATGWYLTEREARAMKRGNWFELLREHIASPRTDPAYYLIRPSGLAGKHLALYAPLNCGSLPLMVRYDVNTLLLDAAWWSALEAAFVLRRQHSWSEIKTDVYNTKFVAERWADPDKFVCLRDLVCPYLFTPYLNLIEFVWTKERLNDECD